MVNSCKGNSHRIRREVPWNFSSQLRIETIKHELSRIGSEMKRYRLRDLISYTAYSLCMSRSYSTFYKMCESQYERLVHEVENTSASCPLFEIEGSLNELAISVQELGELYQSTTLNGLSERVELLFDRAKRCQGIEQFLLYSLIAQAILEHLEHACSSRNCRLRSALLSYEQGVLSRIISSAKLPREELHHHIQLTEETDVLDQTNEVLRIIMRELYQCEETLTG